MSHNKPKSQPSTHAINFSLWNMDGGPLPDRIIRRLEGAIESIIKDSEKQARCLYTVTKE